MPVYQPDHVEYAIVSGRIQIALENGQMLPAFWAHPNTGGVFPGIVLAHDWWGLTDVERHLANLFAQAGYYVIAPDLFDGRLAAGPQEAYVLVEQLGAGGYPRVDTALQALETHTRCNRSVAAVGLGLGGTLAFQAALTRDDLEAAVACYGFPQRFLGQFSQAKAPILALYGSDEPHVPAEVREALSAELQAGGLPHEVVVLEGATRDFFAPTDSPAVMRHARLAWQHILAFLERFLEGPARPPDDAL